MQCLYVNIGKSEYFSSVYLNHFILYNKFFASYFKNKRQLVYLKLTDVFNDLDYIKKRSQFRKIFDNKTLKVKSFYLNEFSSISNCYNVYDKFCGFPFYCLNCNLRFKKTVVNKLNYTRVRTINAQSFYVIHYHNLTFPYQKYQYNSELFRYFIDFILDYLKPYFFFVMQVYSISNGLIYFDIKIIDYLTGFLEEILQNDFSVLSNIIKDFYLLNNIDFIYPEYVVAFLEFNKDEIFDLTLFLTDCIFYWKDNFIFENFVRLCHLF